MENKSFIFAVIFAELTVIFGLSTWTLATISKDLANKVILQEETIKQQQEHIIELENEIKELVKGE